MSCHSPKDLRPRSLLPCLHLGQEREEKTVVVKFWRFYLCNEFLAMSLEGVITPASYALT